MSIEEDGERPIKKEEYGDFPIKKEEYGDFPIKKEEYGDFPIKKEEYHELSIKKEEYDELPIKKEDDELNAEEDGELGAENGVEQSTEDDNDLGSEENDEVSGEEGNELSGEDYSEEDEVFCYCDRVAKVRMSGTDKNPDRLFYCCSKKWPSRNNCGFFQWCDEPLPYHEKHKDDHLKSTPQSDSSHSSDEPPLPTADKPQDEVNSTRQFNFFPPHDEPLPTGDKEVNSVPQSDFFQRSDEPIPTGYKHRDEVNSNRQFNFFPRSDEPLPGLDEVNLVRSECIRLREWVNVIQQKQDAERSAWYREKAELLTQLWRANVELEEVKKRVKVPTESDPLPPLAKKVKQED